MTMLPMSTPFPPTKSPMRRLRFRRRPKPGSPESWNLTLLSANTGVPFRRAAESPTLLAAVVEDFCWRLAVDDLAARKPHRWHRRARAAWREEQARLEAKRCRVAAMATEAVSEL